MASPARATARQCAVGDISVPALETLLSFALPPNRSSIDFPTDFVNALTSFLKEKTVVAGKTQGIQRNSIRSMFKTKGHFFKYTSASNASQ